MLRRMLEYYMCCQWKIASLYSLVDAVLLLGCFGTRAGFHVDKRDLPMLNFRQELPREGFLVFLPDLLLKASENAKESAKRRK